MFNDIFKTRSCYGCIGSAVNTYSNNFNKIMKGTWLWVVILSLLAGLATLTASTTTGNTQSAYMSIAKYTGMGVLLLAVFFSSARVVSGVISMTNGIALAYSMKKIIKVNALILFMIMFIGMAIAIISLGILQLKFVQSQPFTTIAISMIALCIIIMILAAIFMAPMIYSVTRYIFLRDVKFREIFGKSYGLGFRHLGFLFTIACTTSLLFVVICVFLCMPGCITFFAYEINLLGVLNGDASGLPSYFVWLNALSSAIMSFILQYLAIWVLLTYLYAYGGIDVVKSKND